MELWELSARESIRDLVARYNAGGDSGRFDEVLALFAEDAVMEIVPGRRYEGRDEIRSLFTSAADATEAPAQLGDTSAADPKRFIRHFTATHQIDVDSPDIAHGRAYYAVLTESGLDHWGRYVDDYVRQGERWLFRKRRVTVDGAVAGGWSEQAAAHLARAGSQGDER